MWIWQWKTRIKHLEQQLVESNQKNIDLNKIIVTEIKAINVAATRIKDSDIAEIEENGWNDAIEEVAKKLIGPWLQYDKYKLPDCVRKLKR